LLQFQLSVSDGVANNTAMTAVTVRRAGGNNPNKKGCSGSLGWLMLALLGLIATRRRRYVVTGCR
jgi:hypothetical protein